jgi:hypothetical protein
MEQTSTETANGVESTTYAMGKVKMDTQYAVNPTSFKNVQIVEKLPEKVQLGGDVETADVAEDSNAPEKQVYYNGENGKVTTTTTLCNSYTTSLNSCYLQTTCGVCGSKCIAGNRMGPHEPCPNQMYQFVAPNANWNPLDSNNSQVEHKDFGGAVLTTIRAK